MPDQKSILLGLASIAFIANVNATGVSTRSIDVNSKDVSAVEVVLTQPNISTRAPVREKDLPNYGCTYTSTGNAKKSEDLIQIINSELSTKNRKSDSLTLRNAIYIYMLNGTKIKILLSDSLNVDNRVYGKVSTPSQEVTQVESSETLLIKLRSWASSEVSRQAHSSNLCDFK